MNKLKVLFTTNIPVPYRIQFFNELGKYVDLTVLFERKDAGTRNQDWLNDSFKNFKGIFLNGIKVGDDLAFCPSIIQFINKEKFDKIIIGIYYSPTGILLTEYLRLKHIPFIMTGDGGFIKQESKFKYLIKRHLNSKAQLYLTTSEISRQVLNHYGIPNEKIKKYSFTSLSTNDIITVPLSVDEKQQLKKKLSLKESFIILGVGRLLTGKGWKDLIDVAYKLNENIGIYIVGGNPQNSDYKQCIKTLPANFHFIDFMQKDKLKEFYGAADVFILPSRSDVWGLVINEAMSMGLPIISTYSTVAATELIEEEKNGFLYHAGDIKSLYQYLKLLIDNPLLREQQALNNLSKIKSYTIENMALEYYHILTQEAQ